MMIHNRRWWYLGVEKTPTMRIPHWWWHMGDDDVGVMVIHKLMPKWSACHRYGYTGLMMNDKCWAYCSEIDTHVIMSQDCGVHSCGWCTKWWWSTSDEVTHVMLKHNQWSYTSDASKLNGEKWVLMLHKWWWCTSNVDTPLMIINEGRQNTCDGKAKLMSTAKWWGYCSDGDTQVMMTHQKLCIQWMITHKCWGYTSEG